MQNFNMTKEKPSVYRGIRVIRIRRGVGLEDFSSHVGASGSIGLGGDGGRRRVPIAVSVDHPHVGLLEGPRATNDY